VNVGPLDTTFRSNIWNVTQQIGTRITQEGTYIGGNFWANLTVTGFSETCNCLPTGFCDTPYIVMPSSDNIDYLPLCIYTAPAFSIDVTNLEPSVWPLVPQGTGLNFRYDTIQLHVVSATPWHVNIGSLPADGNMTSPSGKLHSPLQIAKNRDYVNVNSGSIIDSGGATSEVGNSTTFDLKQWVQWIDRPSPNYTITLNFIGSPEL
jgi:hypothetical protein